MWLLVEKNRAMKVTIFAGLLAGLFPPTIAVAQTQRQPGLGTEEFGFSPHQMVQAIEKSEQPSKPVAKVSEAEATKIALQRIPGKVTDVKIERKRGQNVYVVEIQTPDGGEKDVFVSIESGEIVGTD